MTKIKRRSFLKGSAAVIGGLALNGIAPYHFKKTPFLLWIKFRRVNDLKLGATVAREEFRLCKHRLKGR